MTTSKENSASQETNASSWFRLPSNPLQSMIEATRKAGAAANVFVQKTVLSSNPSETVENSTSNSENQFDFTRVLSDLSSNLVRNAQHFKQMVEEKTFLGNLSKEQEKFIREKRSEKKQEENVLPPWSGHVDEEHVKEEVLKLSQDERNFLRNPPSGADFQFEMSNFSSLASFLLENDEKLRQMRFQLVPKQITEEIFWRNYFYRVNLIENSIRLRASSTQQNVLTNENRGKERINSDINDGQGNFHEEFVSDEYDTSAIAMEDIRREIEQISGNAVTNKKSSSSLDENEWDKGLTDDMEGLSVEELEAQINQMLEKQEN